MSPSPSKAKCTLPLPPRFTATTPASPTAHPRSLRPVSRSWRKSRAEKRIAKKLKLASMIELVMPAALERPM